MNRNRPATFLRVFFAFLLAGTIDCDGVKAVAGAPLGAVFGGMMDEVNTLITNARNAGDTLLLRAGSEAQLAIQSAQAAFDTELDKSISELDAVATEKVAALRSMVDQLERQTAADAMSALEKAQQIANTLPFSRTTPQLTSISPQLITLDPRKDSVTLTMHGNFFHALDPALKPSLVINGNQLDPGMSTTQELTFVVPVRFLPLASPTAITLTAAKLTVPYLQGDVNPTKKIGTFSLLLSLLPRSPGQIAVSWTQLSSRTQTRHVVSNKMHQDSSTDDDKGHSHCDDPIPEHWSYVTWSAKFVMDRSSGDWSFQSDPVRTTPQVCFSVTTIHHCGFFCPGDNGNVDFHFEYDISQEVPVETPRQQQLQLTWGDSKIIPGPMKDWKVTFDSFDGHHQEFAATDMANPYLKVETQVGGSLKLSVPPNPIP